MGKNNLNEKELMDIQRMQTYFIDMRSNTWGDDVENLNEMLPCIYHINNKDTIAIEYLSEFGEKQLDRNAEDIVQMGVEFLNDYVHPNGYPLLSKIADFYQGGDEEAIFSFFQKVRLATDKEYEWLFTSTKIYKKKDALITIACPVSQLADIGNKMNRILDENLFMKKHFKQFMSLTKRERELVKLLAQGLSCSQIGNQLFIATQTVEKHRKNIYKKLEINNILDLLKYAQAFDLV